MKKDNDNTMAKEMKDFFGVDSLEEVALKLGYSETTANNWYGKNGISTTAYNKFKIISSKNTRSGNSYTLPLLNIKASAGGGIKNYSVEVIDNYILDKHFFKTPPQTNKLKIVQVEGDSMETTIQDGAFVVIDESKQGKEDGIYAIILDNQVLIKRLQFRIDGSILIISDNPKYQTQTYNTKDTQVYFSIIGRKILTIQR